MGTEISNDGYDFAGRVVTITGAGSGFGRLTAQRLAAAGARLAISDINASAARDVAESLRGQGAEVLDTGCDVSRAIEVARFFDRAISEWGRLDIAINNAGMAHSLTRLADCSEAVFDESVAVNLKGVFLCMKQELIQMLAQGKGVIVNLASVAGLVGSPFMSPYAAAKHGVVGLTRTAAVEYGRKGIRVNAVCPAFSATGMLNRIVKEKGERVLETFASYIPMQRLAQPEEVVDTILWLCSDRSSFMNGAAVPVDGGLTAG